MLLRHVQPNAALLIKHYYQLTRLEISRPSKSMMPVIANVSLKRPKKW